MGKYGHPGRIMLKAISEATGLFEWPIPYTETWRLEQIYGSKQKMYQNLWRLEKRGLVKSVKHGSRKFFKLTSQGELELLLEKAVAPKEEVFKRAKWDGKWRLVLFDIPEDARDKRDQLRTLLKQNGFKKLQASVFISPRPLNRECIGYLKETGLIEYIRIIKIEEMDDDRDLRKEFNLQ